MVVGERGISTLYIGIDRTQFFAVDEPSSRESGIYKSKYDLDRKSTI